MPPTKRQTTQAKSKGAGLSDPIINNEGFFLPANLQLAGLQGMFLQMTGTVMSFMYSVTVLPTELNSMGIGSWGGLVVYLLMSAGIAMTLWKTELPKTFASLKQVWAQGRHDYSKKREVEKHQKQVAFEQYQRALADEELVPEDVIKRQEAAAIGWENTTTALGLRYLCWLVCLGCAGLVALITLTRVLLRAVGVLAFLGFRFWYWGQTPGYQNLSAELTKRMMTNPILWAGNVLASPGNVLLCAAIGPLAKAVIQYIRLEDPELSSSKQRRLLIQTNNRLLSEVLVKLGVYLVLFTFGQLWCVLLVELALQLLVKQGYVRQLIAWMVGSKRRAEEKITGPDQVSYAEYQRHLMYQKLIIGASLLLSVVFVLYSIGIASIGSGVMSLWTLIAKVAGNTSSSVAVPTPSSSTVSPPVTPPSATVTA